MKLALIAAALVIAAAGCKKRQPDAAGADRDAAPTAHRDAVKPEASGPSPATAKALASPKPEVRLRAVRLLAKRPPTDPEVIAAIVALLSHDDPGVRMSAATALTYVKNAPQTTAPLEKALSDGDPLVRFQALKALAKRGAPAALEGVIATLADDDVKRRAWAVSVLANFGEAARPHWKSLVPMLEGPVAVRLQAIRAIGKLGDGSAIDPLIDAAGAGGIVRAQVTKALEDLPVDDKTRADALARLEAKHGVAPASPKRPSPPKKP